jgi:hypothetical protein
MKLSRREAMRLGLFAAGTLAVQGYWSPAGASEQAHKLSDQTLKNDVDIAWRYFTAPGASRGLLPSATWPEGDGYGRYDILTMWDIGSFVIAYISARSMGLINESEFDTRIKTVMSFLRRSEFRWGKLTLPNFRTGVPDNRTIQPGFDATDTGRLLSALYVLDKATNGAYPVKKQIERWNLDGMITNGRLHDIKSSSRFEAKCFNYVHYVARAFNLWGIGAKTGFDTPIDPNIETARLAFLKHVSSVGPIGTEPNVTEAIELGHSVKSRILADVLYEAQKERFTETGHLTCVSEAPTDKKPYFTYQGYNIDAYAGPRWPVDAYVSDAKWKTDGFADAYRMVSTKAAYLWFAERGDDYASKLRRHVLEKAPSKERGFHSGVYEGSGRPVKIFDVNTNAAVLAAMAYINAGRKPLAEIRL